MKIILFLLLSISCHSQQYAKYIPGFGGLNTFNDSSKISDTDSQDLLNVITENGYIEKRPGSVLELTALTGYPVKWMDEYISPSNIKYLVFHASNTIYATDFSTTPVVLSTVNPSAVMDAVSAFGKKYFTNGYDNVFSWDGTTVATSTSIPKCKYIEFADERLYCGNVGGNASTLYASAFGDPENWTIPAIMTADSATSFTFQKNDGEEMLCLISTPWGKVEGKRHSMGILKGQDNDTYYKRIISPNIGCLDNRSMQMVDGILAWLAEDGIYSWNGSGAPVIISKEIEPNFKNIRQVLSQSNFWNITSQSDFETGLITKNGPTDSWDTQSFPGSIFPSSSTYTESISTFPYSTLVNVDTYSVTNRLALHYSTQTPLFDSFSGASTDAWKSTWTFYGTAGTDTAFQTNTPLLRYGPYSGAGATNNYIWVSTSTYSYGTYKIYLGTPRRSEPPNYSDAEVDYYFISSSTNYATTSGYMLKAKSVGDNPSYSELSLYRVDVGTHTRIGRVDCNINLNIDATITINRTLPGIFTITSSGVKTCPVLSATDNTHSFRSSYQILHPFFYNGLTAGSTIAIDELYTSQGGYASTGSYSSQTFDTKFSTPVGGEFTSVFVSTPSYTDINFYVRQSSDSANWGSWVAISTGIDRIQNIQRYWQYKADFSTTFSSSTPNIQTVTMQAVSTGTYDSKVQFIGNNITAWKQFVSDEVSAVAEKTKYYVRSATYSFLQNSASPAWTLQTNGLDVVVSTAPYFQWRVVSSVGSSSDTIKINAVQVNWVDGNNNPVASLYHDRRYYLSVNIDTSTIHNDTTFVYQKSGKWTKFNGKLWDSMSMFNFKPYAGDGSVNSHIWNIMNNSVYADNGDTYESYWISKDFGFDFPNQNKVASRFWIETLNVPNGEISISYSLNRGDTYVSKVLSLDEDKYINKSINSLFDGFGLGKYFRFKFYNDNSYYFKIDSYSVYYDVKPIGID